MKKLFSIFRNLLPQFNRFFLFLFFAFFCNSLFAQIQTLEKREKLPEYFLKESLLPTFFVDTAEYQKFFEKENISNNICSYGVSISSNLNTDNCGVWEVTENGDKFWRMAVEAKNAKSIALVFSNFNLPEGAKLFIYNNLNLLGAFTSANNRESKILPTAALLGERIVVEYFEPATAKFHCSLIIRDIMVDLRGVTDLLSGDCNIDINCEEGAQWQVEKHSVCKYTFISNDFTSLCTGVLINNTSLNGAPLFLTANHCASEVSEVETMVLYFNYEHITCNETPIYQNQTLSGASLLATAPEHRLDFNLVELAETPPQNYLPYYAGWNISETPANTSVTIHHPQGDVKKISFENDQLITGNYGEGYDEFSHWQVLDWELGTTEGGSSGAPLFNANHQVVGTLTGGEASCDYNFNDYFSKISRAWDDFAPFNQQLKYWLDPNGTNLTAIGGYDPYGNNGNPNLASPTNLNGVLTGNTISLSWVAPLGYIDGYNIYLNTNLIATINNPLQNFYVQSDLLPSVYNYYVSAIYGDDESLPSNTVSFQINNTAVESVEENFLLYPNPCSEFFSISNENNDIELVYLTNIEGRIVKNFSKKDFSENNNHLNINDLPYGLYIVTIVFQNKVWEGKLLKIK